MYVHVSYVYTNNTFFLRTGSISDKKNKSRNVTVCATHQHQLSSSPHLRVVYLPSLLCPDSAHALHYVKIPTYFPNN